MEEAILLHLLDYSRYEPEDTVPMELAQAGISRSLGVRRSHVSISLDAAKTKNAVEEHLARVKGERRRRKCYFLTDSGKELARTLEENINFTIISAKLPDGTDFEGEFSELMEKIHGFCLPRIALLATDGIVKLPLAKSHGMAMTSQVPEIENFVRFNYYGSRRVIRYRNKEFFEEKFIWVDNSIFDVFSFKLLK